MTKAAGGLRGRLALTLAVVSLVALAIAAVTLLSPLERRLRDSEIGVVVDEAKASRPGLARLPASAFKQGDPRLAAQLRSLRRRTGARVVVLGPSGEILGGAEPDPGERFPEALRALRKGRTQVEISNEEAVREVRVALGVASGRRRFAIDVRKPLDDAADAAKVVRKAFVTASALSLIGASLLGFLLAGRLVRRLRSLRDTALRVADMGPVVEVHADEARDEVGDLTRAFATMQDRLRHQEQARRAFVSTASHELRTPLSSLRLILDDLERGLGADGPDVGGARELARRADAQAERLSTLATELLDLSRIDARLPMRTELVDVTEIVRSVVAEFEVRSSESGHTIDAEFHPGIWAIGDPGAIAQVVRVLVDNGLRHTPAGTAIEVSVHEEGGEVAVAVSDNGPGVAPAERDRIFGRFERGAASKATPGFGLGLAIARELTERMQGKLDLEPGDAGARFVLTVPAAPPDAA